MKKIIPILIAILLVSCSSGGKKPVEKLYYRLAMPNTQIVGAQNFIINKPSALGIIGNRPMVATNSDGALHQMNNNFWLDSPKTLLHNYLKAALKSDKTSQSVLTTQIIHLEKNQNTSILAINFSLIEKGKTVFDKTFEEKRVLNANTIPAFVKAINDSLSSIIKEFTTHLK